MLRGEQIDRGRAERTARGTIMTSVASGQAQAIDVDEWLYRATRVRAFTPTPTEYVPRHRAEGLAS